MFRITKTKCILGVCAGLVTMLSMEGTASAEKRFKCPDGEDRIAMDPHEVAIQYEGTSFGAAIGKVNVYSSKLSFAHTQLQQATSATQQWNQLVLGLVVGWNSCAISGEQYGEGVLKIYPRLKEDAQELDDIALLLSKGQDVDEYRLRRVLASYIKQFRRLAEIDGLLDRMVEVLSQTKSNTDKILVEIREMRQTCTAFSTAAPVNIERTSLTNRSIPSGSAFTGALSRLVSTASSLPTSQQTISSLTFVSDSSNPGLLSLNQASNIVFTSTSSQTTFSTVTLNGGRTPGLVTASPILGLASQSLIIGPSSNSLWENSAIATYIPTVPQATLSGLANETFLTHDSKTSLIGFSPTAISLTTSSGEQPSALYSSSLFSQTTISNSGIAIASSANAFPWTLTPSVSSATALSNGLIGSPSLALQTLGIGASESGPFNANPKIFSSQTVVSPGPCAVSYGLSNTGTSIDLRTQ